MMKNIKKQEESFRITALSHIKYNFPVIFYTAIY